MERTTSDLQGDLRVGLHVTDRCQLDCDHCSRDPGQQAIDLDFSVIEAVLRSAVRSHGASHVSLTGGEPTLHPRFADILDLAVSLGMTWDMVSNGRRYDRVARWLEESPARRDACRIVMLSMDGASDEVHDRIRGEGQRREVLAAMAVLVAARVPFGIAATVHAMNVHEIEDLVTESAALGATVIRFAMTQPTGTPLDDTLRLDPDGWRDAARRVRACAPGSPIPVLLAEGWPTAEADHGRCLPLSGERVHVDVHGRLTLCCAHSGSPSPADDGTVAGPASGGLTAPVLGRLGRIQRETRAGKGASAPSGWTDFECNGCLALHGRPHWTGSGTSGSIATRDRWRGSPHRSIVQRRILRVVP